MGFSLSLTCTGGLAILYCGGGSPASAVWVCSTRRRLMARASCRSRHVSVGRERRWRAARGCGLWLALPLSLARQDDGEDEWPGRDSSLGVQVGGGSEGEGLMVGGATGRRGPVHSHSPLMSAQLLALHASSKLPVDRIWSRSSLVGTGRQGQRGR